MDRLKRWISFALIMSMVLGLMPTTDAVANDKPSSTTKLEENKTSNSKDATIIKDAKKYVSNTGKTYYVDADNGDDDNDGLSEEKAWKTLLNVNATTFAAGDAVLFKRGCIWKDTFLVVKGSGNKDNPNYISCYGDESLPKPAFVTSYVDSAPNLPKENVSIYVNGSNCYWTIENLDITVSSNNAKAIIKVIDNAAKGMIIRNCVFSGGSKENWSSQNKAELSGIVVDSNIDGILIENNEVYNCKAAGITINGKYSGCNYDGSINSKSGKGVVIRNNYLENIGTNGIFINNCLEPLCEYNVVNKSHSYATTSACAGIWPFACYGALFQYNEAYDTRTIYDGQGFDCDYICYNTTFQYNYSHNNVGGFMLICVEPNASWMPNSYAYNVGSTVRYNISQNDYHYIFSLTGALDDTRIYNNTIYCDKNAKDKSSGTTLTAMFFQYSKGASKYNGRYYANNMLVANNIFYNDKGLAITLDKVTNLTYKNNMATGYGFDKGLANGKTTYVTDSSGKATDVVSCIESSGNIYGYQAGFVNGGAAGIGRDTCDGYMLYEDSKAIDAGVYIEDGYHACPNDFYGNPIDKEHINIGAYQGKGVKAKQTVFDGKYKTILDFENDKVGATGTGELGEEKSGVDRCREVSSGGKSTIVKRGNNKMLMIKNTKDTSQSVSSTYFLYPSEKKEMNGFRVYLDSDGVEKIFTLKCTVTIDGKSAVVSKSVKVSRAGYYLFTFNEKYGNTIVTPEIMKTTSKITLESTLGAYDYIYVDNFQANIGEADSEQRFENVLESATTLTKLTAFDGLADVNNQNNEYGSRIQGPAGNYGITTVDGKKAFFTRSESSSNTTVAHNYSYATSIKAIKEALLKGDIDGLQFNIKKVGYTKNSSNELVPLTDDEKYRVENDFNKVTLTFNSGNILKYMHGTSEEYVMSLGTSVLTIDDKGVLRVTLNNLSATYTETVVTEDANGNKVSKDVKKSVYYKDLTDEQKEAFAKGISSIKISYTTCGATVEKTLVTYVYLYEVDAYKGVNHAISDWRVLEEATCTEDGYRKKACAVCGYCEQAEIIKKTGHTLLEEVVNPTCTSKGYKQKYCMDCSYKESKHLIDVTDHKPKRYITKEATCTSDGEGYEACEYCGLMTHEYIIYAKMAHDYKYVVTKVPTKTQDGLKEDKCTTCGHVRAKQVVKYVQSAKAVTKLKVKIATTKDVTISFNKSVSASACGYDVYIYINKKWKKTNTLTKSANKVTIKSLQAGKKYKVKVVTKYIDALGNVKSGESKQISIATKPKKVTGIKVSKVTGKKGNVSLKVSWKKVTCSGYVISYSTNKNMKSAKKIKVSSKNKNTVIKIANKYSKNKFYVRVKAFVK